MRLIFLGVFVATLGLAPQAPKQGSAKPEIKLWAAITVNDPVFEEDNVKKSLSISFALVNDGEKVVVPDIESSKLLVNGKPLKNWENTVGRGLQPEGIDGLRPGHYILFAYGLGEHFTKSGTYKISWKGKNFEAPEIVFRVIPTVKNP